MNIVFHKNSLYLITFFLLMMVAYNQLIAGPWAYLGFVSDVSIGTCFVAILILVVSTFFIKNTLEGFAIYFFS